MHERGRDLPASVLEEASTVLLSSTPIESAWRGAVTNDERRHARHFGTQRLRNANSASSATGNSIQSICGAGCVFGAGLFAAASTLGEDASKSFVDIEKLSISASIRGNQRPINQDFERAQALGGSSEFMRGMRRLL